MGRLSLTRLITILVISLVLFFLLFSCAPSATPTSTPVPAPTTQASSATTPAKVIELRIVHPYATTTRMHTMAFVPWAAEVEKRTGGRLKVTYYPAEALGKMKDFWDMARTGVSDASAIIVAPYTPGKFPVLEIGTLPFSFPDIRVGTGVVWDLWKKGYCDKEFEENKVFGVYTTATYQLFTKKPIQKLEDLKGVKIRSSGAFMTPALELLGATALSLEASDIYTAMDKGVMEGFVQSYGGCKRFRLFEVSKYVVEIGAVGIAGIGMAMNKQVWNSLPKDLQGVLDGLAEQYNELLVRVQELDDEEAKADFVKSGIPIYVVPPQERTRWAGIVKPTWDSWITACEKRGLPAQQIMKEFVAGLQTVTWKPK